MSSVDNKDWHQMVQRVAMVGRGAMRNACGDTVGCIGDCGSEGTSLHQASVVTERCVCVDA